MRLHTSDIAVVLRDVGRGTVDAAAAELKLDRTMDDSDMADVLEESETYLDSVPFLVLIILAYSDKFFTVKLSKKEQEPASFKRRKVIEASFYISLFEVVKLLLTALVIMELWFKDPEQPGDDSTNANTNNSTNEQAGDDASTKDPVDSFNLACTAALCWGLTMVPAILDLMRSSWWSFYIYSLTTMISVDEDTDEQAPPGEAQIIGKADTPSGLVALTTAEEHKASGRNKPATRTKFHLAPFAMALIDTMTCIGFGVLTWVLVSKSQTLLDVIKDCAGAAILVTFDETLIEYLKLRIPAARLALHKKLVEEHPIEVHKALAHANRWVSRISFLLRTFGAVAVFSIFIKVNSRNH